MKILLFFIVACSVTTSFALSNTFVGAAEKWGKFEVVFTGPSTGNPFTDNWLTADFIKGSKKITTNGFYDGNGVYKVRFMPTKAGEWNFRTKSNSRELNNKTGKVTCVDPSAENHGPVTVNGTYNFSYADGKKYYPFGTTIYAWTHQPHALQEETPRSLANGPFNKVRMCVFPTTYVHVETPPELYPYKLKSETKTAEDTKIRAIIHPVS